MRTSFTTLLVIFTLSQLFGSDTLFTHIITEDLEGEIRLSAPAKVFFDAERAYSFEDFLQASRPEFSIPTKEQLAKKPLITWSAFTLVNQTERAQNGYFPFWGRLDSVEVYVVENNRLVDKKFTGRLVKPQDKTLLNYYNDLPFSIDANSEQTYVIRTIHRHHSLPRVSQLTTFYLVSARSMIQGQIINYATQFFYFGMMLIFALISLFMFGLFREKVFIYFSGLMFFLIAYFLTITEILRVLVNRILPIDSQLLFLITPIISGILLTLFLFISNYINLRSQLPKYYRFYLIYTTISVVLPLLTDAVMDNKLLFLQIHNFLTIGFIIISLIPLIILNRRGSKPARIVLFSILTLAVCGAFHVTVLITNLGIKSEVARFSFQIGTVVFSGILFYGLFQKISTIRAEKQRFQELDELKSRFFTNISHEFRTPLTLVMGPVKEAAKTHPDPQTKKQLLTAHQNAQRLLELINQLLDLSKLEAGKMQLQAREQNFSTLLKGIVMSFESLAVSQNIRLHFSSRNEQLLLFVDTDKIEKIFFNLLSNAFKFTEENGEISIIVTEEEKAVEVLVRDTGIGIEVGRLPHIFDRFFQADDLQTNEHEGTGIGLALVKELVELHGGTIAATSEKGKGTAFVIRFLKGQNHLNADNIVTEKADNLQPTRNISPAQSMLETQQLTSKSELNNPVNAPFSPDIPIVLIIDDNADIRAYIRGHLATDFQIIEAENGQDGIEKAIEHLPDLVISDVMMPKKNGYEVCETLKTDLRTSHIPVILLTAKAAREEKIQGLETGADDYLIKPFDSEELLVRVQNLIKIREQLRLQFATETKTPKSVGTNETDRAFYENVVRIIEEKLGNEQFSVEVLAAAIGMSRVQLNRKLKALTNQTASKFIQGIRLQTAHDMLLQRKGNVSEIAFETGFSSTAYFVKCYREQFGETPGSVLKN